MKFIFWDEIARLPATQGRGAMSGADEVRIGGYRPGAVGWVVALHGRYYGEVWGLNRAFEAEVARGMGEFMARFDPAQDGFWLAARDGAMLGSITIDHAGSEPGTARLRWFVVDPAAQGLGIGRRLLDAALAFCRARAFRHVELETFVGLDVAKHLYEAAGFRQVKEWLNTGVRDDGVTFRKLVLDL
jgi:GNAT superfamily N-acetyltransferase